MTRRNFIDRLLVAGAGFMVLPGTGRLWRAMRVPTTGSFVEFLGPGYWVVFRDNDTGQVERQFAYWAERTPMFPVRPGSDGVWRVKLEESQQ